MGSVKASTTSSPCQPLGQSGNAKPPSLTTSGGTSGTCSPKLLPTRPSPASPSSQPPAPTTSSVPQPMDLDCTHPVKRDPHHGLCFNCGKPGHIAKVC